MNFSVPFLCLLPLALPAQTLVEYSAGTAGAAGAATGMRSIGKAASALFDKANKTLDSAPKSPGTVIVIPKSDAPAAPVKLSPPPDPAAVGIGMDAGEAIARFGQPAMKVSSSSGSQPVETWSYGSAPDEVILTLRGGKVSAVSAASRPKEVAGQEVVIVQ